MKPVVFHPEAFEELQAQAAFYESRMRGLGTRFMDRVEAATNLAAAMPNIGSPYSLGTRRVFPRGFPTSIVYLDRSDRIIVIAIAPFRRQPGYWYKRR